MDVSAATLNYNRLLIKKTKCSPPRKGGNADENCSLNPWF